MHNSFQNLETMTEKIPREKKIDVEQEDEKREKSERNLVVAT